MAMMLVAYVQFEAIFHVLFVGSMDEIAVHHNRLVLRITIKV
jgi:hypothetical protein